MGAAEISIDCTTVHILSLKTLLETSGCRGTRLEGIPLVADADQTRRLPHRGARKPRGRTPGPPRERHFPADTRIHELKPQIN